MKKTNEKTEEQAAVQQRRARHKEILGEEIKYAEISGSSDKGFDFLGQGTRFKIVLRNKSVERIGEIVRELRNL